MDYWRDCSGRTGSGRALTNGNAETRKRGNATQHGTDHPGFRDSAIPRLRDAVRIGVLVSGHGTHLQAILAACARGDILGRVAVVVSSTPNASAPERERPRGSPWG